MKDKKDCCKDLKELLEAERPMFNIAVGHRRFLISEREHKRPEEIDWDRAQTEFLEQYGNAWMEGFKLAYCNFACKDRETCALRDSYNKQWEKYENEN